MTLAALLLQERERGVSGRSARLATLLSYLGTAAGAGVAFWPLLWHDPAGALESVQRMAHFPWRGDVLFLGRLVPATHLLWHYAPVWVAITTPLSILFFFVAGTARALREACTHGAPVGKRVDRLLLVTWVSAPILVVILLRSVLYDGWRQLYFVYPALVMLATLGIESAWRAARHAGCRPLLRVCGAAALLALAFDLAVTTGWMVRWHPHQNVYFNAAAGGRERVARSFDLDYWGLGCRQLLKRILALESKHEVAIMFPGNACWASARLFPAGERTRLVAASRAGEADYVVAHHRRLVPPPSTPDERLVVRVDGLVIASARRLNAAPTEGPSQDVGGEAVTAEGLP
jgi:hypothetical protein